MKKVTSILLALAMCLSLCVTTFAAEQPSPAETFAEEDLGAPIKVVQSVDEFGNDITTRYYFVPDTGNVTREALLENAPRGSLEGSGWLYKFKDVYYNYDGGTLTTTVWVGGYFTWANFRVQVSSPYGGFDENNEPIIGTYSGYVSDYGNSSAVKVYAHVTYHYVMNSIFTQYGDVTLKVNGDGTYFN